MIFFGFISVYLTLAASTIAHHLRLLITVTVPTGVKSHDDFKG